MDKQNSDIPSTRDGILDAVREVAKTDEGTANYLERLEPFEKAKEIAESRFEPKEAQDSKEPETKEPEPKDTSVRGSIEKALKAEEKKPTYEITDEDKQRVGYQHFPHKDSYSQLSPEFRDYLDTLTKETLDQKAAAGRQKHLTEIDEVLKPYKPKLKELGVNEAQLVGTLFSYASGLSNENTKYPTFAQLCADFDIDLSVINDPKFQRLEWVEHQLDIQEQERHRQAQSEQTKIQENANALVGNWAKNKEHYSAVRKTMTALIVADLDKFTRNGNIDLDLAYSAACRAHGLKNTPVVEHKKKHTQHEPRRKPNDKSIRGALRDAYKEVSSKEQSASG